MSDIIIFLLAFFILGIVIGGLSVWLVAKFRLRQLLLDELQADYVLKAIYQKLEEQADLLKSDLAFAEQELRKLSSEQAADQVRFQFLEEKLLQQKQEMLQLQQQARLEFENLANRLLEEKSERFTLQNKQQVEGLLQPLKEKIKEFSEQIDIKFLEETKQRSLLQQEMQHLRLLNTQLSHDANNLVNALKGESQAQGAWGELRLELLLEKAGLERNIHYRTQASFKDENGQQKRPDFIVELPDSKQIIIDSKVSLSAYERFFNCEEDIQKSFHLKEHLESIQRHIKELSQKNYQQLYQINTPDYVLLFIPMESAFALAMQHSPRLFLEALEQNVVLVTSSTLLATMRTVSYIWKQERQKKNVLEIARQSGLLYDKFVGFVEDLTLIGQKLEEAQRTYQLAFNKLKDSPKYGDTLIGRSERIKELGAKASKSLPSELLEDDLLE